MQNQIFLFPSREPAEPERTSTHNLPAQLTPLIGREQEVATACTLLRRPEVRLLTLTGTGGVGKTRLGLQISTDLLHDFYDGVCLILLAPISDPDLVVPTIAQTLGIKETGGRPLFDQLKAPLQHKHLLLFLDNFEQVVTAASVLTDLLETCPALKLLVSSREVLRVRGEQELPVPLLALPNLKQLPTSETMSQYAAIALFLQRAQAVKPDFQITDDNASTIATICTRLDGLPLALELAAARLKHLSLQALLARLEHRFQVLTQGPRDVHERQQTLRNTIQWSYDLLDAREHKLFRRLAVFVGGCTLEAIEAICTALDGEADQALSTIASLIDKSLLKQAEQEGEEPRFVMLETIREYGLECLATKGEMDATRHAHASYFLALAEQAVPELEGPQAGVWLAQLEREHDNLRAALQWSLDQVGDEVAEKGQEMGLRLAGALWGFWYEHGHLSVGSTLLERALAGSQRTVRPMRGEALSGAMYLSAKQGDYDRAEALGQEILTLGDTPWLAMSFGIWGGLALQRGNLAKAHSLFDEGMTIARKSGNKQELALACFRLAQVLFVSQSDPVLVGSLLEESLAHTKGLRGRGTRAYVLLIKEEVALSQGDAAKARELVEESLALYRETGERLYIAEVLYLLASVEAHQGNILAARDHYKEGLAVSREMGNNLTIAPGLEGLATVVTAQGEFAWAAQLWGTAYALRNAMGTPIPPVYRADYERAVTTARNQLGEQAFAAAWAET